MDIPMAAPPPPLRRGAQVPAITHDLPIHFRNIINERTIDRLSDFTAIAAHTYDTVLKEYVWFHPDHPEIQNKARFLLSTINIRLNNDFYRKLVTPYNFRVKFTNQQLLRLNHQITDLFIQFAGPTHADTFLNSKNLILPEKMDIVFALMDDLGRNLFILITGFSNRYNVIIRDLNLQDIPDEDIQRRHFPLLTTSPDYHALERDIFSFDPNTLFDTIRQTFLNRVQENNGNVELTLTKYALQPYDNPTMYEFKTKITFYINYMLQYETDKDIQYMVYSFPIAAVQRDIGDGAQINELIGRTRTHFHEMTANMDVRLQREEEAARRRREQELAERMRVAAAQRQQEEREREERRVRNLINEYHQAVEQEENQINALQELERRNALRPEQRAELAAIREARRLRTATIFPIVIENRRLLEFREHIMELLRIHEFPLSLERYNDQIIRLENRLRREIDINSADLFNALRNRNQEQINNLLNARRRLEHVVHEFHQREYQEQRALSVFLRQNNVRDVRRLPPRPPAFRRHVQRRNNFFGSQLSDLDSNFGSDVESFESGLSLSSGHSDLESDFGSDISSDIESE